jgi:hypothetical protein
MKCGTDADAITCFISLYDQSASTSRPGQQYLQMDATATAQHSDASIHRSHDNKSRPVDDGIRWLYEGSWTPVRLGTRSPDNQNRATITRLLKQKLSRGVYLSLTEQYLP